VGIAAGIFLGWEIIPVRDVNSEPQTLRIDFKTDFVLMVSELYYQDGDLTLALDPCGKTAVDYPLCRRECLCIQGSSNDAQPLLKHSKSLTTIRLRDCSGTHERNPTEIETSYTNSRE